MALQLQPSFDFAAAVEALGTELSPPIAKQEQFPVQVGCMMTSGPASRPSRMESQIKQAHPALSLGRENAQEAKKFRCRIKTTCRLRFPRLEHLIRHERTHTGEKPFECHCTRRFNRMDNWKAHVISQHKDDHQANEESRIRLLTVHKTLQMEAKDQATRPSALTPAAQCQDEYPLASAPTQQAGSTYLVTQTSSGVACTNSEPAVSGPIQEQSSFWNSPFQAPYAPREYSRPNNFSTLSTPSSALPTGCAAYPSTEISTPFDLGIPGFESITVPETYSLPAYHTADPSRDYGTASSSSSISTCGGNFYRPVPDMGRTQPLSYGTLASPVLVPSTIPATEIGLSYSKTPEEAFGSSSGPRALGLHAFQPIHETNLFSDSGSASEEAQWKLKSGYRELSEERRPALLALDPRTSLSTNLLWQPELFCPSSSAVDRQLLETAMIPENSSLRNTYTRSTHHDSGKENRPSRRLFF